MREMLMGFRKEVLVEYMRERGWFNRAELERDLLFIDWDLQAKAAQKIMDDACERMQKAKDHEEWLSAQKDWDKGDKAYKKADRIYQKMEALK